MQPALFAFLFAFLVMFFGGTPADAGKTDCSKIYDSAMCLMEPGCWFDVNERSCMEGTGPGVDACASHGSQSICDGSSLGCMWNAEGKTCVSKPK